MRFFLVNIARSCCPCNVSYCR